MGLSLPDSCSVAAVLKHRRVVIDVQEADGDFAVSGLQPVVSQHHQHDLRAHLKVQRIVRLHTDLTWMMRKNGLLPLKLHGISRQKAREGEESIHDQRVQAEMIS